MYESVSLLRGQGMEKEAQELLECFRKHADYIMECGKNYPPHEVNYEQSIVAPAAAYLCDLYRLTGEEKYAQAARIQLAVLDLFRASSQLSMNRAGHPALGRLLGSEKENAQRYLYITGARFPAWPTGIPKRLPAARIMPEKRKRRLGAF